MMKFKIQLILSTIVLSFLISFGSIAQTQSQKLGTNPTNIVPSAVLEIESANKGVLFPRVELKSTTNGTLPIASPATGLTVFNTASDGTAPNNVTPGYYYWNGSKWVKMAIETPFAKTVYVNAASPSTATIFDENNPPATNDDALKSDDVNLYIGNNGSTWTFNTSTNTYNTFIVPAATPFNLAGTTTDAGSNKLGAIWRSGSIGIGINNPLTTLHVQHPLAATNSVNANAQVLRLSRPAAGGVKEDNFAQFNLGSYENTGTSSFQAKTRLDLALKDGVGTASTNVMTWNANGRVGILNTAPTASLDVINPLAATQTINADAQVLRLSRPTGPRWGNVAQFNLGSYTTGGAAHSRLDFALNDGGDLTTLNNIMTLQANGNVGIGTTAPLYRLDINGGSMLVRRGNNAGFFTSDQILFGFSSTNTFQHAIKTRHDNGTSGNAIDFYTWSSALNLANTTQVGLQHVMSLDGSGRVGIGGITAAQSVIDAASISVATASVNASRKMLRLSIPTATGVKFGNVAEFNMGSYAVAGTSARTRLDLLLNDVTDNIVSQVMTWQANGNVGIGINNPANRLSVLGNARIQPNSSNNGTGDLVWFEMYGKTSATSDTQVGGIKLGWYDSFGGIEIVRPGSSIGGLGLAFNYANSSGTTTEGFRLNNSGNVGIGTTSPTQRLQVAGNIAASGTVSASGTTLTSDARLKSNIVNLSQGLSKIMQLNPVNYDKKEALDSATTVNENGFIAQELQKIMPELVSEGKDKDKLLSVNYTAIIPVLTKAVQEQQVIIEENKATIQKQQDQINELKVLLEKLLDKK
jgi:hypothetical protein